LVAIVIVVAIIDPAPSNTGETQTEAKPQSDAVTDTKSVPVSTNDAAKVKKSHDKIAAIENEFISEQDKFMKLLASGMDSKKHTKKSIEKFNSAFNEQLAKMQSILDRSDAVIISKLENEDATRYLTEAIDTHKKWSLMQKAKITAVLSGDLDNAKQYGLQCDELASKEALALVMAYKVVGLKIE